MNPPETNAGAPLHSNQHNSTKVMIALHSNPEHKVTLPPSVGEIRVITGGLACGGPSRSAQRAGLRKIRKGSDKEVATLDRPFKQPRQWTEPITFTDADCTGILYPHDDPLVISALISNLRK